MTRKTRRFPLILGAAAVLTAGGLAGCSKQETAPQPVVKKAVPKEQAKAAETAKPAEPASAKPPEVVFYNPAGKRDPFVPFLKADAKVGRGELMGVPPLQRFDIGELRFVGVIWGPKGVFALVEDPEGKGYTVTVGTKIGRGGGAVTRISQDEIVVKENFLDYTGTRVVRESSMKLHNAGGQ